MANISERNLHKMANLTRDNVDAVAAVQVLALAYYNMVDKTRMSPPGALDCPKHKYQALAQYWGSKAKNLSSSLSLSDSVEYDVGLARPKIVRESVNSCFLTEDCLDKAKGESPVWSQFLEVLREQGMTLDQYIAKYL